MKCLACHKNFKTKALFAEHKCAHPEIVTVEITHTVNGERRTDKLGRVRWSKSKGEWVKV